MSDPELVIRRAKFSDLEYISQLEFKIDKDDVASLEDLEIRFNTYPEGFLVIEEEGTIVGYIESCLCDLSRCETWEEIKDFSKQHDPKSKCLHIIFIGVDPDYQHRHIGTRLLQEMLRYAKSIHMQKVQLIATETNVTRAFLLRFYQKNGFNIIRTLEHFSPECKGIVMELLLR